MTAPKIDAGDWLLFTSIHTPADKLSPLGGPWFVGKATTRYQQGWNVEQCTDTGETRATNSQIRRSFLSRGEAMQILLELRKLEDVFVHERDTLYPRYQLRRDALLLND